ncbi:unnamed protein product [Pleuronectes platessa]|uniref:Uncharacterized protein n=1 Tax=Pleuronectes platessa TaxID=8262 RepID=A0A9N7TXY1_PLEPL|nr:unnamed protein product [Pleuronectes platessa]
MNSSTLQLKVSVLKESLPGRHLGVSRPGCQPLNALNCSALHPQSNGKGGELMAAFQSFVTFQPQSDLSSLRPPVKSCWVTSSPTPPATAVWLLRAPGLQVHSLPAHYSLMRLLTPRCSHQSSFDLQYLHHPPVPIVAKGNLRNAPPLPALSAASMLLNTDVSGAKHNAFSHLTSRTHGQSTEQQESEDNITLTSFTLTLPGESPPSPSGQASLHNNISHS